MAERVAIATLGPLDNMIQKFNSEVQVNPAQSLMEQLKHIETLDTCVRDEIRRLKLEIYQMELALEHIATVRSDYERLVTENNNKEKVNA